MYSISQFCELNSFVVVYALNFPFFEIVSLWVVVYDVPDLILIVS